MATFNYKASQDTAQRLIKQFGFTAIFARVFSTYDEVEGERTITDVQTDTPAVVNLPASISLAQNFENRVIEEFKKGKIRFFYAEAKSMTFEPESGDLLFFDSKVWEVAGATPLNPAGTPIYHTLAVRASNLSAIPMVP